MPSKRCPGCGRIVEYSSEDWKYVSGLDEAVCSRKCAFDLLQKRQFPALSWANILDMIFHPEGGNGAGESYSPILGMFFRSDYERYVAEAFSESGMPFEYEHYGFRLSVTKVWTPDFRLTDTGWVVEVKGAWGLGAKTKISMFKKKYQYLPLLVLPWTIHEDFYPPKAEE